MAAAAPNAFVLDDKVEALRQARVEYRAFMFWGRMESLIDGLTKPGRGEVSSDILMSDHNLQSQQLISHITSSLKPPFALAGAQFWEDAFLRYPFVFLLICQRILRKYASGDDEFSMAFRMDALYGLDWTVPLCSEAFTRLPAVVRQEQQDKIRQMWQILVNEVFNLIKVPNAENIASQDPSVRDQLNRERDRAVAVLGKLIQEGLGLNLAPQVPPYVWLHLRQNLNFFSPTVKFFVLICQKPQNDAVDQLEAAIFTELIDFIGSFASSAANSFKRINPESSPTNKSIESSDQDKSRRVRSNSGPPVPDDQIVPFWTKPGAESPDTITYSVAEAFDLSISLTSLEAFLSGGSEESREALRPQIERVLPHLVKLCSFPASPKIRGDASNLLIELCRPDGSTLDHLWKLARTGPKADNCSVDFAIMPNIFESLIMDDYGATPPKISVVDLVKYVLMDDSPDASVTQESILARISELVVEAQKRKEFPAKPLFSCIPALAYAAKEADETVSSQSLAALQKFIDTRSPLLRSHKKLISSTLDSLASDPTNLDAIFVFGSWLLRSAEAKLCISDEVEYLAKRSIEYGSKSLARMTETETPADRALPLSTLLNGLLLSQKISNLDKNALSKMALKYLPLDAQLAELHSEIGTSVNDSALILCDTIQHPDAELAELVQRFKSAYKPRQTSQNTATSKQEGSCIIS